VSFQEFFEPFFKLLDGYDALCTESDAWDFPFVDQAVAQSRFDAQSLGTFLDAEGEFLDGCCH